MRLKSQTVGLSLLACVALTLRLAVVWQLSDRNQPPEAYEHGEIAENLVAGRGFTVKFLGVTGPTSQQAPLYPAGLAVFYAIFGSRSFEALLAMRILQCLAGTALVLCVTWLSWSLIPGSRPLGWFAGWGAAVYPTHLYMVTHIQVALWAALNLTLLLAVVVCPDWRSSGKKACLAGVLVGVLLLLEPILALVVPMVGFLFWRLDRSSDSSVCRRISMGRTALLAGTALLTVTPWIVRNYRVHGELVFVKSTFGYAFWQGNNPASWGTDKIPKPTAEAMRQEHDGTLAGVDRSLWAARRETLYIDDVLLKPNGWAEFAGLTEPERSRLLFHRACQFIREKPASYLRLCGQRLRYFLLFDETNPRARNLLYRAATVTWLVMAFTGVLVLRPHWRRLWPTLAIFGLVTLFHSLTIVSARFRIPIEPLSFVWCAAAVTGPLERIWQRLHRLFEWRDPPSQKMQQERGPLRPPHYLPIRPKANRAGERRE